MAESEEEVDVLVQRVVKDITNAFKRNPGIDEIGLIPCPEARYNRSPIVLVENKLGVESWCVKFLLPYVHNKLLLYRQRKQWLDREALVDITSTVLLLNPDFTTAWNVRKELLQCGMLNPEKDLYLGKLALTKYPKSPETWIHRRWVLQRLQKESCGADERSDYSEQIQRAIHEEMKVCADAAGRYASNYNAWSHRIWVLQHMAKGSLKILHDELSSTRLWVSMHVSDHSGFHYRQFLLKALLAELGQTQQPNRGGSADEPRTNAIPQLFHDEIELCTDLIESYPGHETLWCHRRHVFYLWHHWRNQSQEQGPLSPGHAHTLLNNSSDPSDEGRSSQAMDVDCTLEGSKHGGYTQGSKRLKRGPPCPTLLSEHAFISRILSSCRNPEQGRFASAYRKWLDSVIGQ
ncbi:protein prenyltransferase alpha subunit repeat-containing protein 1 isoform X2 [Neoarius graeffei]|uniref:protein prenyltransferase alpha subunit repeat-containing protein 1 isoform X2 n=1 Tax=Neoarius graeffei TaxID=443677 RepID=UPI00298C24E1|nr:protein prenyltransferase alpha subunit repeat-containing protein 1 isoform X2 [Neoarius graeffei]